MEYTHRQRGVASRQAVGVLLVGLWMVSCRPGTLPCDDPAWKEVCEGDGGISPTGGRGGSGGGSGGMSGGMGGMAGGGAPTCRFTTAAEVVEMLIIPGCAGVGTAAAACHGMGFEPKFTNAEQLLTAVLDVTPKTLCKQDKYVNKAEPGKSFFSHKAKGDSTSIMCPSGGNGGLRMPFGMPKLPQADIDCLEWWAYEVSK